MTRILFICGRNRWRSPTAERIFSDYPGVECESAGLDHDAENPVSPEILDRADLIFVMERIHKQKLSDRYQASLGGKRIICLDIPDRYKFMDPALVKILVSRVSKHLPHTPAPP